MITGDHPSTAAAIARQVNIFSEDISKRNGIDTFQIEENDNNHSMFRLYRNEALLKEHMIGVITPFRFGSKATKAIEKHSRKNDFVKEESWYKQWLSSCKAQFTERTPIFDKQKEKEKIPYAVVVR